MKAFKGKVFLAGRDLSSEITSVRLPRGVEMLEITSIDDDSRKFMLGEEDGGEVSLDGIFDDATNKIDAALRDARGNERQLIYCPAGDALSKRAIACNLAIEKSHERSTAKGSLVGVSASLQLSGPVREGKSVSPKAAKVADGNGTLVDETERSTGGGYAWLQVMEVVDCTNIIVKIQDSPDDNTWADLVTFTAVTPAGAPTAEEKTVIANGEIDRYVRANWAFTAGGAEKKATFQASWMRLANLLSNSDFETGDPPSSWTLSGAGASWARSDVQKKYGSYSGKLTRAGTDCMAYQDVSTWLNYVNREMSFGAWVWASVASRARISLNDGVGTTQSSFHTGSSSWEWLSLRKTINSDATQVRAQLEVVDGDMDAHFDNTALIKGVFPS